MRVSPLSGSLQLVPAAPAKGDAKKGEKKGEDKGEKKGEGKGEKKGEGKGEKKGEGKGEPNGEKKSKGGDAPKEGPTVSALDIRVGTIVECGPHPDAGGSQRRSTSISKVRVVAWGDVG